MIETLRHFDLQLFHLINQEWANRAADIICPVLRNKNTWIPLYLIIAYFFFKKYGNRVFLIGLLAAVTILLTDQLSSSVIKPFFHRLRPCNNVEVHARLLLDYCGAGFSFVSSHAANHFGIAAFLTVFIDNKKHLGTLLFVWALLVSLSQVYVGVHYPLDVLAGALLGIFLGCSIALFGKNYFHIDQPSKQQV